MSDVDLKSQSGAEELAERISAGDRSAEQDLVNRYSRGLMFMLRNRTRDLQLAEDLHQETFCIVIERLREGGLNDPSRLSGFIHRTAANLHIGVLRKNRRRRTDADSDRVEIYPDERESQLAGILREESGAAVRSMIGDLKTPRDREVIRRFYLLEQDKSLICASLELTERHFDRVIHRARSRFREVVESKLRDQQPPIERV